MCLRPYDLEEFLSKVTQFAMISNPSPGDEVRIRSDQPQINFGQVQSQTVWEQIKQWLRW